MLVSEVVLVRVPSHTTRFLFAHQGWVRTVLPRLIGKAFGGRPGPKGSGSFPSALVGSNSPLASPTDSWNFVRMEIKENYV